MENKIQRVFLGNLLRLKEERAQKKRRAQSKELDKVDWAEEILTKGLLGMKVTNLETSLEDRNSSWARGVDQETRFRWERFVCQEGFTAAQT